jgi:HTH-type transcriptional regulator / antitoxin HipB
MKKVRGKSLKTILTMELEDNEFRIAYEKRRFHLEVAHLIRELRKKSGMSQSLVAKHAGVSQPMIARLEAGDDKRTPTLDTIYKVLRVLGYTFTLDVKPLSKVA